MMNVNLVGFFVLFFAFVKDMQMDTIVQKILPQCQHYLQFLQMCQIKKSASNQSQSFTHFQHFIYRLSCSKSEPLFLVIMKAKVSGVLFISVPDGKVSGVF